MPDFARGRLARSYGGQLRLQCLLALLTVGMGTSGRGESDSQHLLVPDVGSDIATSCDDLVGEQAQPGVSQRRLDDTGLAGDLRLSAQRTQLAAQLRGQVGEAGEIGRHGLELAQRLFFALTVFENTGRLLDKGAAVLRAGVQDRVQLPLADDDMKLTADSGVTHELLDVEQPT